MKKVVIHLKGGGIVPLPEGWELEAVLRVLREVGHSIKEIEGQEVAA